MNVIFKIICERFIKKQIDHYKLIILSYKRFGINLLILLILIGAHRTQH